MDAGDVGSHEAGETMNSLSTRPLPRRAFRGGRLYAGALAVLLVLSACTSTRPPDRVALSSLETIRATSESVLRVHASLYDKGLSTPERRVKVDKAYVAVNQTCNVAALGVPAVKTWADMARVLAEPEAKLNDLKALVPEFKGGKP